MGISATDPISGRLKFLGYRILLENTKEKSHALSNNFGEKCNGGPEIGFAENGNNFGKPGDRKQNSEGRQGRLAKFGGLVRMAISNKEDIVGARREVRRLVPSVEIQIALWLDFLFGQERRKDAPLLTRYPKLKGEKRN